MNAIDTARVAMQRSPLDVARAVPGVANVISFATRGTHGATVERADYTTILAVLLHTDLESGEGAIVILREVATEVRRAFPKSRHLVVQCYGPDMTDPQFEVYDTDEVTVDTLTGEARKVPAAMVQDRVDGWHNVLTDFLSTATTSAALRGVDRFGGVDLDDAGAT